MIIEDKTCPSVTVGNFLDAAGHIRYIANSVDEMSHGVTLKILEVSSWEDDWSPSTWEEVAVFYVKWDGCAHIGFRSPELSNEWAHVCGVDHMRQTLAMLVWAWDLAVAILRDRGFNDEDLSRIKVK